MYTSQSLDEFMAKDMIFHCFIIPVSASRYLCIESTCGGSADWLGVYSNYRSSVDVQNKGSMIPYSVSDGHSADIRDFNVWGGPDNVDGAGASEVCSRQFCACGVKHRFL
jgi:hypothetical protein